MTRTRYRTNVPMANVSSVKTEKSGRATGKSALPSRTDIVSAACQVRKVPIREVVGVPTPLSCHWSPNKTEDYSAGATCSFDFVDGLSFSRAAWNIT
jgi:ethanolamine ammonia-lyase large subunit